MNFADMLKAPCEPMRPKRKYNRAPIGSMVRRQRADGRFRLVMEGQTQVTAVIAARLGMTSATALSSLYALEARGLVARAGKQQSTGNRPTILWTWTGS